jgi:hypothetical protein
LSLNNDVSVDIIDHCASRRRVFRERHVLRTILEFSERTHE